MIHLLENDEFNELQDVLYEFNTFIIENDLSYDDALQILEDVGMDSDDLYIMYSMNEGFWDKMKDKANTFKGHLSNAKAKFDVAKNKVANVYHKGKEIGTRVKDHVVRNKYKYGLGAAALAGGVGLAALPFAVGAGHLADKYKN